MVPYKEIRPCYLRIYPKCTTSPRQRSTGKTNVNTDYRAKLLPSEDEWLYGKIVNQFLDIHHLHFLISI